MINTHIEEQILRQEYRRCLEYVKDSHFHTLYTNEKIEHSFQVIGAGNYIMKHEKYYQGRDETFLRLAKLAYLFHDIGRFREICELFDLGIEHLSATKLDHGAFGAEFLSRLPQYDTPFLLLPVKYHNKLIEDYYNSAEYHNLEKEKKDITEILKLVRDADKIANFHLITTRTEELKELFCPENARNLPQNIQPEILEDFMNEKAIDLRKIKTVCDRILNLLSWTYDLNYLPSFVFCSKLNCFDKMLNILKTCNPDNKTQEKVEKKLKSFITKQYKALSSN